MLDPSQIETRVQQLMTAYGYDTGLAHMIAQNEVKALPDQALRTVDNLKQFGTYQDVANNFGGYQGLLNYLGSGGQTKQVQGHDMTNGVTTNTRQILGPSQELLTNGAEGFNDQGQSTNQLNLTDAASKIIQGMQAKGLTINPNVPITPQSAAEFMAFASQNANSFLPYAEKEISPYYQSQFKLANDTYLKNLGYSQEDLTRFEADTQKKYTQSLKDIGVSAAEKGFAQSGQRVLDEQNLASDTQQNLDTNRRTLSRNAETTAETFAQKYGSANLTTPQVASAPRVIAGQSEFQTGNGQTPLYSLSPDVYNGLVGSEQFAERTAESTRASDLEKLYNQQRSLQTNNLT